MAKSASPARSGGRASPRRSPARDTNGSSAAQSSHGSNATAKKASKDVTSTPLTATKKSGTPSPTLYIRNLNEKLHKNTLKEALYFLFAPYGRVLDIVTLKTTKMRGQAHIVFRSIPEAAAAMKALDGATIFKKQMDIHYALSRSRKSEEDERRAKFDEAEDETEVDVSWSTKPLIPSATKDTDEAMDVESIKKPGKSEANDDEDDDEE